MRPKTPMHMLHNKCIQPVNFILLCSPFCPSPTRKFVYSLTRPWNVNKLFSRAPTYRRLLLQDQELINTDLCIGSTDLNAKPSVDNCPHIRTSKKNRFSLMFKKRGGGACYFLFSRWPLFETSDNPWSL